VKVFLADAGVQGIPEELDRVPVTRVVTGVFRAGADRTGATRPAPVGFSIGHPDVTAGTLGARVTDGSNVYVLSNNHVIANSNNSVIGDGILQPGAVDGGVAPRDVIGTLHDFEPIRFDRRNRSSTNAMDAAIALVDPSDVSGATPADEGYGAPGTTVVPATLGLGVQKYGRTTGHTFGTVTEIDVTVSVCYAGFIFCNSSATFQNQIGISHGTFSDGGDSGSLIVTDGAGNNPVALLFAGSDLRTIASPIQPVLDRFGVVIDPTVPGTGGPSLSASFSVDCVGLSCEFDASSSIGANSYSWDFGDGKTGAGQGPIHEYADDNGGSPYTVVLTVEDAGGSADQASMSVTVSAPPSGGGDPVVDQFAVTNRSSRRWDRAEVSWAVSDPDADLAQVTVSLATSDGTVLDSATTLVSGSSASGAASLRSGSGTAAKVVIIVSDALGNVLMQESPFN
jgi:hypothetical protein